MYLKNHHKPTFDNIAPEKRNRILQAAAAEFAHKGFENAGMSAIAKNADVSVGSLYKYFENKQDLFFTVLHYSIARMEKLLTVLAHSEADLLVKVESILREIQSFSKSNAQLIKLYNEMTSENDAHLASSFAYEMESITAQIYRTAIEEAQKAGEVRTDIDPAFWSFMLDNLFITLQFSYSCEYYKERFHIYAGSDIEDRDDFVVEQTLKFVKAAFK